MARVYDENGKIVGTTEAIDVRLNQSNELYKGENLDEVLVELAKVFDIDKQLLITKLLLGLDEENQKLNRVFTTNDTSDNDYGGELLFQLKDYNGNFTITEDDITTNSPSGTTVTYTLDETTKTLKISSTNTTSNKAYRGIRINNIPKIDVDFNKKAVSVVIKCKTNAPVNIHNTRTNQDYFIGVDDNGFSSYKSIRFSYPFYNNNNNYYMNIEYNGAFDIEIENIRYYVVNKLPTIGDVHNVNVKVANMNIDGLDGYAPLASPVFTGSISLGRDVDVTAGTNSFAVGTNLIASGANSHAEGYGSSAYGGSSHAEGYSTTTTGTYSHAEGNFTTASGSSSHSEGYSTKASGNYSHAEGRNTTALGDKSHAEGYSTNTASSKVSSLSTSTNDTIITAWNSNKFSLAKGDSSHVEGMDNLALGRGSHAEGAGTIASSNGSHSEGMSTTASGVVSHAEGGSTTASGYGSHSEGNSTIASGDYSHAEGYYTLANGRCQHVQGKYNIEDTENKYAHIVGNGEYNDSDGTETRSNAHTLDWQGNAWYKGELYTGGTSQADGNKVLTTADISFNEAGELVVTINGVSKTFVPKSE